VAGLAAGLVAAVAGLASVAGLAAAGAGLAAVVELELAGAAPVVSPI
jgi:hypothetical protein